MDFGKWENKERSGKFKDRGGVWNHKIKVRTSPVLWNTGCFLEEGVILSSRYSDKEGNENIDNNVGYHYISLLKDWKQAYFAFKHSRGWRVLSDDALTFVADFKTKSRVIVTLISLALKLPKNKQLKGGGSKNE